MDEVKPFLRWAGSKRKQIPRLRAYWRGDHARYVEPFAGSACFFLALAPDSALLSDKNADLIEAFRVARAKPQQVYDGVAAIPRTATKYYAMRKLSPASLGQLERAIRFIYLNRNCFNGIYRTNGDGQFNVPFATSRAGEFVTRDEFFEAAKLLKRATLQGCDFGRTLMAVRKDDFVYLDPPYAVESRRVFREYGAKSFSKVDLTRFKRHLHRIDSRGATFLVSYADCKEGREMAKPWNVTRMRVRRNVAGFTRSRRSGYELLISNS
jgi:DNA adenine methylase